MRYLGFHVSAVGGPLKALKRAYQLKSTAFSFFTKNQRKWKSKKLSENSIISFKKACKKYAYNNNQILPHSSYLINLGHPKKLFLEKSRQSFIDELNRCLQLGLLYLNVHPGNHLKKVSEEKCLEIISKSINISCETVKNIIVVIENTAGQGSSVGYNFSHLSNIISNIKDKNRVGVCLDTCHLFASGYDLSSEYSCDKVLEDFDQIVGIKYLKGIHLNDAKSLFNSRVDRHHSLGYGNIGVSLFKWVMNNKNFFHIPIIIESINSNLWEKEIKWLRSLI
ncbi:deoxyribonuclease IV [Buchnera aphidicola (Thelaxes californica)]|uniref:Probable endonuclease 4 n=1 Tax=Buchnera aphidicola (Thelaxes californica) TaxID=1315998 RepID=A0A4D6YJJ6_9GAMM|nr:deoxyribonuclease IV [Buchnera aphidicola]QCI26661.1 deoxyribonuclease IV [Buchnera aphidicola (Thelaxes californica)]